MNNNSSPFQIIDETDTNSSVKPQIKSVTIITPSIATKHLEQNMLSVQSQVCPDVELTHLIVSDGADYLIDIGDIAEQVQYKADNHDVKFNCLFDNVGKSGFYGHRVYAAFSYLVNTDAVIFLDEDNWIEPNHVASLVKSLNENGVDWGYTLRKIYSKDGEFLCEDNCESLGGWLAFTGVNHVDTSAYILRTSFLVTVAHNWYGKWGQDRKFLQAVVGSSPNVGFTGKHTLCYRLDGNPNSVSKEFFDKGNSIMKERFPHAFPWVVK